MIDKKILTPVLVVGIILVSGFVLWSLEKTEPPTPTSISTPTPVKEQLNRNWFYNGPIYETHPNYYDGTFKGLTAKIPEIANLGVKTIYLMPIWEQPVGSADKNIYHISDYYKINTAYGSSQELKDLVNTAHNYNIKVLFDLVTCCAHEGSVVYNNNWVLKLPLSTLVEKSKTSGLILEYDIVDGNKYVYSGCTRTNKLRCTVAGLIKGDEVILNTCPLASWGFAVDRANPEVIDYFTKVAEYYVREYDIDGWRVDAPGNTWNPKIIAGDHSSVELLRSVKKAITEIKPNAILLSEDSSSRFEEVSDFAYGRDVMEIFLGEAPSSKEVTNAFKNENRRMHLLESHDGPRIIERLKSIGKSTQMEAPLIVVISTAPGIPMIQTGQEIGAINSFSTKNPSVDWGHGDSKLREFYKRVFEIHNNHNALKQGEISDVWKSGDNTIAFLRRDTDETIIIIINLLDKTATTSLDLSFLAKGTIIYDELNNEEFIIDNPGNFPVHVSAYGSRILTIKR